MRKSIRSLLLALTCACALFAISHEALAQDAQNALAAITKNGVIRIAVPQDFPPFGSVSTDMKPVGYDVDMANLIAKGLGVKAEIIPVASTNRIPYLTTGKVDLVISSLGKNPEREAVIDFSDAYAPFFNGVFGPDAASVAKAEDLAGKTIAVTRGSVEDLELTKIAPSSADIKRFEDNNGTISAYLSGQVELVATGNVVAAAINEKKPAKKLAVKFLVKNSPCFIGMNKSQPELKAKVNGIVAAAKTNGELAKVADKWLHAPLPADL